ncbi:MULTISPECIES: envelope stress response membrane protein PspC [unclassified Sphingomonas]|uniref:envelope stress response membrane protein PspC n=1 Tax=unclassified Sphingomonas TaxID=196159 RepID=UPI000925F151|nr:MULTISPECIES: envelope stress response membrane protein PspC [unclassified Sphingomonas]OJU23137.1 MAG: phage shock protein C [Sphingomonas sp. 66-10]
MADESSTKFYLDKQNAKWKGVCAGIADYTGIDPLWVRLGTAAMIVIAQQWWIIIAYLVIAWVTPNKPIGLYRQSADEEKFWQGVRANPKRSTAEVRSKFRELDRRLADIELHYTSRNTQLADEIERLR